MIYEVADIRVAPDQQAEFEAAIKHGVDSVISKSKGFEGYSVGRSIETPGRYLLRIRWTTLENHTVDFRESAAFQDWRAIVGPFFLSPPSVEHFEITSQAASD